MAFASNSMSFSNLFIDIHDSSEENVPAAEAAAAMIGVLHSSNT